MKKQRKQTSFKEDAGKLFIDLSKLVFGSIFLAGVLRGEVPQSMLVIGGFSIAAIFFILGLIWVKKEKKE